MQDLANFSATAKSLARNPLGIIALFIVLVYGFACLVTTLTSSLTAPERLPLIWFVVIFPILVLAVFAWLVSCHSGKLFAPADFRDEENYVKMQMNAVGSLVAAKLKSNATSEASVQNVVDVVQSNVYLPVSRYESWKRQLLWVDDRPENNVYERQAFESIGLQITLALSTEQALNFINHQKYGAIISDMGRREGAREGYVLLDELRTRGIETPFFIYASSNAPEHKLETVTHGGQGCTNNAEELFALVVSKLSPA